MLFIVENGKVYRRTLIGHIDLDAEDSINEGRVNGDTKDLLLDLKKVGKCDVYVYSGEGPNEHFHIVKGGKNKFECCVRIYVAEFFPHEPHHKLLSKSNLKKLDAWLRENNEDDPERTNWQVAKDEWKENNKDFLKTLKNPPKEVFVQPNYIYTVIPKGEEWREVV